MLGLDRSAGQQLEESDVPIDVHTQINRNGFIEQLVSRGQPSRDRRRGRPIECDLRERQVDGFGPRRLGMNEPDNTVAIDEEPRGLRTPGDPQQQLLQTVDDHNGGGRLVHRRGKSLAGHIDELANSVERILVHRAGPTEVNTSSNGVLRRAGSTVHRHQSSAHR